MMRLVGRTLALFGRLITVTILAGSISGVLVCFAPGTGLSEQDLNFRRSAQSILAVRRLTESEVALPQALRQVLRGIGDGSLGTSIQYGIPVSSLLRNSVGPTLRIASVGWIGGWILASLLVIGGARWHWLAWIAESGSAFLILMPTAALACVFGLTRVLTPYLCVMTTVFSRLLPLLAALATRAFTERTTQYAAAGGMGPGQILRYAILPSLTRPLRSLLGVTVNLAIGTTFVAEAVCDLPGLGSFAIRSAMARDPQPVIVISALICAVTVLVNPHHGANDGVAE